MGSGSSPTLPTLLTFAPMVDSETSRLLLAHYGIAYRESDHLFGWVSLLTLLHGGGLVPLLTATACASWDHGRSPSISTRSFRSNAHSAIPAGARWHRVGGGRARD
jgi:hypothetical protein